jgi:hypothetical protein
LNPVENLWHDLSAHHWSNRLYRDYDELQEEAVQEHVYRLPGCGNDQNRL